MFYYLMHKDIKVLKLDINSDGEINKIVEIYDINHMPYSTNRDINKKDSTLLKMWWKERTIPLSRNEYENIINTINKKPLELVIESHGLSLNDQYWIKKEDEELAYDDISFFSNEFSDDLGDILIGKTKDIDNISYYSPDSTSTGDLKKRWKVVGGHKVLLKAGSKPFQYEIFNEIIASKIMSLLSFEHIDYSFFKDETGIYCLSRNFVNYNEDFVTAYQLYNSKKVDNNTSIYNHLISIYKDLNIDNYKTYLNQMLFIDYIVGNVDRHLNNFGVIRDAKTLKFIRIAPIYDTGSCLGFNLNDEEFKKKTDLGWKPFKSKTINNQLQLIDDYLWLDVNRLNDIPKEVDKLLIQFKDYISLTRRELIISFIVNRIKTIFDYLGIDGFINYTSRAELTLLEEKIYSLIKRMRIIDDLIVVCNYYNISYITAYRAMSSLTKKGMIKRKGSRKTGYWEIV